MDEDGSVSPDLKDLETKLGRKAPDSLVRLLAGGRHGDKHEKSPHFASCKFRAGSADLKRLESKMLFLRQEMVSARRFYLAISPSTCRTMSNFYS